MTDFSDRPLVAGSVVGLRAFEVDKLGRLVGPAYGGVFKPGENVGECRRSKGHGWLLSTLSVDPATFRLVQQSAEPSEPEPKKTKPHQVGQVGCTCGFYAYTDERNDYAEPSRVAAVVEGYGVCTVGDRGFRAEKARLLALVLPTDSTLKRRWDSFSYWADGRLDVFGVVLGIGGAITSLVATPALVMSFGVLGWFGVLSMVAFVALVCGTFRGINVKEPPAQERQGSLLRRNYPDVPVYRTVKAALAAHPLSTPPTPTPETAEDFWEREAAS